MSPPEARQHEDSASERLSRSGPAGGQRGETSRRFRSVSPTTILHLQRTIGNRAVSELIPVRSDDAPVLDVTGRRGAEPIVQPSGANAAAPTRGAAMTIQRDGDTPAPAPTPATGESTGDAQASGAPVGGAAPGQGSAPGSTDGSDATEGYKVILNIGTFDNVSRIDLARALFSYNDLVTGKIQLYSNELTQIIAQRDQNPFYLLAETIAAWWEGVQTPDISIWEPVSQAVATAATLVGAYDFDGATAAYADLTVKYNQAQGTYETWKAKVQSGAEAEIAALEVVVQACVKIEEVAGTALLGGSPLAAAITAGMGKGVEQAAIAGAEGKQIDWAKFFVQMGVAAASEFLNKWLLGGPLKAMFESELTSLLTLQGIADKLGMDEWGAELAEEIYKEHMEVSAGLATTWLIETATGGAIEHAVDKFIEYLKGNDEAPEGKSNEAAVKMIANDQGVLDAGVAKMKEDIAASGGGAPTPGAAPGGAPAPGAAPGSGGGGSADAGAPAGAPAPQ